MLSVRYAEYLQYTAAKVVIFKQWYAGIWIATFETEKSSNKQYCIVYTVVILFTDGSSADHTVQPRPFLTVVLKILRT